MRDIAIIRVGCAALLASALAPGIAHAQSVPRPGTASNACKLVIDDDDDDAKPVPAWKRFAWEEACIEISGELTLIYQKQKANAAVSLISSRQRSVTNASELTTLNPTLDINTTRQTALGELKTTFSLDYTKTSTDGNNGLNTLSDATVTWAGINVGYTDSQVNFWDGDFQFTATSPKRTVGLAGYEFKLGKDWTLTFAYETGLPTTQVPGSRFITWFPDDPVASARLYYDADDVLFQLAGLVHEARVSGSHPLLAFLGRPQEFSEIGWVATVGATLPVKWGKDGNEFSMQATYAVNASPYLGTAADFSSLASTIAVPVTTEGWSIVGSYHHVWSEHWEMNLLASYLALDIATPLFHPTIRTQRYAANLIWKPVDDFKIGAEIGYVDSEIDFGGPLGLLNGISGKGTIAYLFATWSF